MMTSYEDLIWVTAFIEAEGCITISSQSRHRGYQLQLSVSNTDTGVIAFMRDFFQVGYISTLTKRSKTNKPAQSWGCVSSKAIQVIEQIQPWLKTKQKKLEARLAIDFRALQTEWWKEGKYVQIPDEAEAQYAAYWIAIREAKKMGRLP